MYAKYDAISLAHDRSYHNLDIPVKTVLQKHGSDERVATCTCNSTLLSLMQMVAEQHVHRIVIIDPASRKVDGIVSLSDMLAFFIGGGIQ